MDPQQRIRLIEAWLHDIQDELKALKSELKENKEKPERTPFDVKDQMKNIVDGMKAPEEKPQP